MKCVVIAERECGEYTFLIKWNSKSGDVNIRDILKGERYLLKIEVTLSFVINGHKVSGSCAV